jgi:hypothetical protein
MYANQLYDFDHSHRIAYVFLAVGVVMMFLSLRRSVEATVALAMLAAETSIFYLALAIGYGDTRDRALNVAIAAAVLTGAALWRTRRAAAAAT